MNVQELREIAKRFRVAIKRVPRDLRPIGLQNFPQGACGDSCLLLGAHLADCGIEGFQYVCGVLPVLKKRGILAFLRASSGTMTSIGWMAPIPVYRPYLRTDRVNSEESDWAGTAETAEFRAIPFAGSPVLPSS